MTVQEVVRKCMKDSGMTQTSVAEAIGAPNQSRVSMYLHGKGMQVDSLLKMLGACGYDLIVRKRNGEGNVYRISEESGEDIVKIGSDRNVMMGETEIRDMVEEMVKAAIGKNTAEELAKATPGRDE